MNDLSRRQFLQSTAAITAAAAIVPRHVLGGAKHVAPSEKIRVGYIGCGTQGLRQLMPALEKPELRIIAVCDPNRKSADYPQWGPDELNAKVRKFLKDEQWARGEKGGLCGREVGLEVVNRFYGTQKASLTSRDCRAYSDFREMLAKEQDMDAVYIMTPEHLHGTIAVQAMRAGKHVISHKPMANVLYEARLARDTSLQTGAATHLFCAAGQQSTPTICEWVWSGAIGPVREVHNWSSRPFWPQGMTSLPRETPPVPEGLEWDLWLGPTPHRPYHPAYTHAVFRGWYEFGTGALGDMGHYSFHQIFEVMKFGPPATVEALRSQFWSITDYQWRKETNHVAYPQASVIRWEFPARENMPPATLHWYDGGMRPPTLPELEKDGLEMPEEGMLFVGDSGKILADFTAGNPRLIPAERMRQFRQPDKNLPRPAEELDQWIRACKGGPESDASYAKAYPFAETILLGTIALRVEKKLKWDAAAMRFPDSQAANKLLRREYRQGWEL